MSTSDPQNITENHRKPTEIQQKANSKPTENYRKPAESQKAREEPAKRNGKSPEKARSTQKTQTKRAKSRRRDQAKERGK